VKTRAFFFRLPRDLIAQEPPPERGSSRLLVLDRTAGSTRHAHIADLPDFVSPGTVIVLNDSRVRKARLVGISPDTGGRLEVLLLEELRPGVWKVLAERARRREGRAFSFPEGIVGTVRQPAEGSCLLEFSARFSDDYLERNGHVPLPPYIRRPDNATDAERYQTVYARHPGSAAAPTAGLHLTLPLLESLRQRGVLLVYATLHVGPGTFLPIRSETLEGHQMHEEAYHIPDDCARKVNEARREGRDVLAVGTTAVRTLESAFLNGEVRPGPGRSALFIYPGFRFQVVRRLLTNFHTPRSTLLVLVAAFAGRQRVLRAYRDAVRRRYRFFSYGDAMLIL
jgi:S-adenosylmethionine:tRNA ribosyltransferase-isomerase